MSPKNKIKNLILVRPLIILLFTSLFFSCSTPGKRFEKDRLVLAYKAQSSLETEIRGLRLKHPIRISKEQVMNHLLSLHYEKLTLFGKKTPIFSSNDVLKITPSITKALNRMKANRILYYEVDTQKGKTKGTIFQAQGKTHWRFKTINGLEFDNLRGSSWRLLPQNTQTYNKPHSVLGNEQKLNWIISNLDLGIKSRRSLKPRSKKIMPRNEARTLKQNQPSNSSFNRDDLKNRLQFLKELRDNNLISKEEYKRKRRALLDQLL